MIRNRRAFADAMGLRLWIVGILAERTHLEALTYKDIQRRLGPNAPPLETIKRHVAWARREYRKDKLLDFARRVRRARQGCEPPYDE